jgi:UDP-glucose 4-epimerase
VPGSAGRAAGLTGTSPAFSVAKAKRLLGWEPQRTWRTELELAEETLVGATAGPATAGPVSTGSATPGSQETK